MVDPPDALATVLRRDERERAAVREPGRRRVGRCAVGQTQLGTAADILQPEVGALRPHSGVGNEGAVRGERRIGLDAGLARHLPRRHLPRVAWRGPAPGRDERAPGERGHHEGGNGSRHEHGAPPGWPGRGHRREGPAGPARAAFTLDRREHALQRERKVPRRLEAFRRGLLEAAPDEGLQRGREELRQTRRVLGEDCGKRLAARRPSKRSATRHHLVEDGPEGEDVGAVVYRHSPNLLGRHVGHGAQSRARVRVPWHGRLHRYPRDHGARFQRRVGGVFPLGEAEVEDLEPPVAW